MKLWTRSLVWLCFTFLYHGLYERYIDL